MSDSYCQNNFETCKYTCTYLVLQEKQKLSISSCYHHINELLKENVKVSIKEIGFNTIQLGWEVKDLLPDVTLRK